MKYGQIWGDASFFAFHKRIPSILSFMTLASSSFGRGDEFESRLRFPNSACEISTGSVTVNSRQTNCDNLIISTLSGSIKVTNTEIRI